MAGYNVADGVNEQPKSDSFDDFDGGCDITDAELKRAAAEQLLESYDKIIELEGNGVLAQMGIQIDHDELEHLTDKAMITVLEDEADANQAQITDLTMKYADGLEERETLRADVQRLLDQNQRQAEQIREASDLIDEAERIIKLMLYVIETNGFGGMKESDYIEDDNANVRALQETPIKKELKAATTPVASPDAFSIYGTYKPGDVVSVSPIRWVTTKYSAR